MSENEVKKWLEQVADSVEYVLNKYMPGMTVTGGNLYPIDNFQAASFKFVGVIPRCYINNIKGDISAMGPDYDVIVTATKIDIAPNLMRRLFGGIEGEYTVMEAPETKPAPRAVPPRRMSPPTGQPRRSRQSTRSRQGGRTR